MTDREIIDEVNRRLCGSDYYDELDETEEYFIRVLVRYTRWIERAEWVIVLPDNCYSTEDYREKIIGS